MQFLILAITVSPAHCWARQSGDGSGGHERQQLQGLSKEPPDSNARQSKGGGTSYQERLRRLSAGDQQSHRDAGSQKPTNDSAQPLEGGNRQSSRDVNQTSGESDQNKQTN